MFVTESVSPPRLATVVSLLLAVGPFEPVELASMTDHREIDSGFMPTPAPSCAT